MKKVNFSLLDQILIYLSDKGIVDVNTLLNDLNIESSLVQIAIGILEYDGYVEATEIEISLSNTAYVFVSINNKGYKFIMATSYVKELEKDNQIYAVNQSVLINNKFQKKIT